MDALSGQTLAQWRGENVEIVALHVAMIGEFHLISTLDDFGEKSSAYVLNNRSDLMEILFLQFQVLHDFLHSLARHYT